MKPLFAFGETVFGYDVPVMNEREVRASAGILFGSAVLASTNAFYTGNLFAMKIFITVFLVEFLIRMLINPKYAPTMILGRLMVSNQVPEYSGAAQKRFAWGLALAIAVPMFVLVVLNDMRGPITMIACVTCLALMFFEVAFGICIGCKLYNLFNKDKATLCPGGACQMKIKHDIQKVNRAQLIVVACASILIFGILLI